MPSRPSPFDDGGRSFETQRDTVRSPREEWKPGKIGEPQDAKRVEGLTVEDRREGEGSLTVMPTPRVLMGILHHAHDQLPLLQPGRLLLSLRTAGMPLTDPRARHHSLLCFRNAATESSGSLPADSYAARLG